MKRGEHHRNGTKRRNTSGTDEDTGTGGTEEASNGVRDRSTYGKCYGPGWGGENSLLWLCNHHIVASGVSGHCASGARRSATFGAPTHEPYFSIKTSHEGTTLSSFQMESQQRLWVSKFDCEQGTGAITENEPWKRCCPVRIQPGMELQGSRRFRCLTCWARRWTPGRRVCWTREWASAGWGRRARRRRWARRSNAGADRPCWRPSRAAGWPAAGGRCCADAASRAASARRRHRPERCAATAAAGCASSGRARSSGWRPRPRSRSRCRGKPTTRNLMAVNWFQFGASFPTPPPFPHWIPIAWLSLNFNSEFLPSTGNGCVRSFRTTHFTASSLVVYPL